MVTFFKIIFGIYYFLAGLFIYFGLSLSFRRLFAGNTFDFDAETAIQMEQRSRWFNVRLYVSEWANVVAQGIFWPAMPSPRQPDRELRFFLIVDAIVVCVILLGYLYPPVSPSAATFLRLSAWALISKLIYFVIYPTPLPEQLRTTPRNAYLLFIGVLVAGFVGIVITITGLETVEKSVSWTQTLTLSISIARDLTRLNISELTQAGFPGIISFKLISSALLFLVFFRTIFRWKDFKRTDQDLKTIAHGDLLKGDFESARNWLAKVSKPDAEVLLLRIPTALGLEDVEKAASYEDLLKRMKGMEKLPFTLESDTIAASLVKFPISKKVIFQYIGFLVKSKKTDEEIALFMMTLVNFRRLDEDDVVKFFPEIPGGHILPICSAFVSFCNDEVDEGMVILENLSVAGRPTTELFRRFLLMSGELMSYQGRAPLAVIYEWYEKNFAEILNYAMKVEGEENIELTLRLLMPILKTLERTLSLPHVIPMYRVLESLVSKTSDRREYLEVMLRTARQRGTRGFYLMRFDGDERFE